MVKFQMVKWSNGEGRAAGNGQWAMGNGESGIGSGHEKSTVIAVLFAFGI
jgi:hypothetical protein